MEYFQKLFLKFGGFSWVDELEASKIKKNGKKYDLTSFFSKYLTFSFDFDTLILTGHCTVVFIYVSNVSWWVELSQSSRAYFMSIYSMPYSCGKSLKNDIMSAGGTPYVFDLFVIKIQVKLFQFLHLSLMTILLW